MGTEIFPLFLRLIQIVAFVVTTVSAIVIGYSWFELHRQKRFTKKTGDTNDRLVGQLKDHILTSLITATVVWLAYFLLTAIGPTFRLLF